MQEREKGLIARLEKGEFLPRITAADSLILGKEQLIFHGPDGTLKILNLISSLSVRERRKVGAFGAAESR